MKYIIVNSIESPPLAPLPGIPTILGILENNNADTEFIDINSKFFLELFSQNFSDKITSYYEFINNNKDIVNNDKISRIIIDSVKTNQKYIKIYKNIKKISTFYKAIYTNKKLYSNFALYYNLNCIFITLLTLNNILVKNITNFITPDIANYRSNVEEVNFSVNFNDLITHFQSKYGIYKDFLETECNKIISKNPDIISVSINHFPSFIFGLHFCYILKSKSNIHINIGGTYFDYFYKNIINLKEMFYYFCDSISIGDNTQTTMDFIKYFNKEISIEDIPNIIYMKDDCVKVNISQSKIHINNLPVESFSGYLRENYFTPEFVLPVMSSQSCYWHKCNFCICYSKEYQCKSVEKFVDELEYLSKKYNTKYFYFWDNALHPNFLSRMADLIIKKNLNIKYSIFARLEKEFTLELLKKIRKSGCFYINFGLDSADENILKYINKGIELHTAEKVIKNCYKANIANNIYIILGHPTETKDNIENSIKFLKRNIKYIDNISVSPAVHFINGSLIYENREKYKALINTSEEERKEYTKKIKNLFEKKESNSELSVFNTIYISEKGIKHYRLARSIFRFVINKMPALYSYYVKFNTILFYKFRYIFNIFYGK